MQLGIAVLALVASLITALFVYLKNPRSGTNVYFGLLIFFISIYPVFNYLAVNSSSSEEALVWAKMILLVSIPQGPLLYFFAETFPGKQFIFNKKRQILISSWVSVNLILAALGLIFQSVDVHDGVVSIEPGPLVFSFGLLHATTIIAGLRVLYKKYKSSIRQKRRQLALVFYGILISFSVTFLSTIVLPIVLGNTLLLALSPVFLTLSVLVVAYSIVAQRLFDIRSAVARPVAYVLIFGTLISIYSVSLFGGINVLFSGASNEFIRQLMSVVIVIPLALSFQPIKNYFDNVTDRIFLHNEYDLERTVERLGDAAVDETDLNLLVKNAQSILYDSIRPNFISFIILAKGERQKFFSFKEGATKDGLSRGVRELMELLEKTNPSGTILLSEDEKPGALKRSLESLSIEVAVRMRAENKLDGFILVGTKQSGSPYTKKDLQLLKTAADELALAVQNALRFEEIGQFNRTLQDKVDEATAKLRRTNAKLQQLDEAKDEFVSMASHQLRTPLTSVKGYLSMVLEGDAGPLNPTQKKLLEEAYGSSQRMVYLVSDFLNVSRIKTGKFMLEYAETNLADIIGEEIDQLRATAKAKNISFAYDAPHSFPSARFDENKIRQVIMNLSDNAIYYSKPGGTVTAELFAKGDQITFRVKDTGIGVPATEQRDLFEKFYRASNARKVRPDGTGIGLFMIKKVIVAHGGTIIFKSTEGKGSTFGFTLPMRKS